MTDEAAGVHHSFCRWSGRLAVRCSRAAIVGKRSNYFAPARTDHVLQAFQQGLTDLGYVDGRNIHMDYRFAEGRLDRMDELASETVQAAPDVIVAVGVAAAVPAKRATSSIPIGMAPVGDPVQDGLVPSLRVASGKHHRRIALCFRAEPKTHRSLRKHFPVPGTSRS